ncbi:hypothetical protein quinque_000914 [Culex quinquefasciatus]
MDETTPNEQRNQKTYVVHIPQTSLHQHSELTRVTCPQHPVHGEDVEGCETDHDRRDQDDLDPLVFAEEIDGLV